MPSSPQDRRPTLRESQKELTRRRIVDALADMIRTDHPLEVSLAAVADRAGVSEPTLYRHFPTKGDLFAALASDHHERLTEGVAPGDPAELLDQLGTVYRRAADREPTVRWLLAAPDPAGVPRPNTQRRLATLRRACAPRLAELSADDAENLLRAVLLLTSPAPLLYWKDYLQLDADESAATARWIIHALLRATTPDTDTP
jgi:AcrR family transcriptional regulator